MKIDFTNLNKVQEIFRVNFNQNIVDTHFAKKAPLGLKIHCTQNKLNKKAY